MEIRLTLALPRDEQSVPVVRRLLRRCLETLGVDEECRSDIELAVTEACTNVLDHVHRGDEYEVIVGVDDQRCVIDVVDAGRGFDTVTVDHAREDLTAEAGRGLHLIRALVDRARFDSHQGEGTVVHLEKRLTWVDGAPVERLTHPGGGSTGTGAPPG